MLINEESFHFKFGSLELESPFLKLFVFIAVAVSHTTRYTKSSSDSTVSGNSRFSAGSGGDEDCPSGQILPHPNLRIFSYSELRAATRNFRSDTVLGEGGFGKVYKGWLDDKSTTKTGNGSVIAVKKLNSESMQGVEEWQVTTGLVNSQSLLNF